MNKFRLSFAVSSILFLVVLAVSPFKDFFREWKGYQEDYNRLVATLPTRVKPAEIGIKQIWNQKFNRIDRCTTCHLGIKEEALKDAREPFRTHPHMYHDVEEFGCTICHEGQGVATEFKESIGKVKYWDKPIFPKEYMEASCAKCHKEQNVPQAPVLNMGRKLIEASNCVGCHTINGYPKQWVPPLNGIGSKVSRTWLVNWLKNPKAYFPQTRMPNFSFSDEEINTLADFLMTFTSASAGISLDSLPPVLRTSLPEAQKSKLIEHGSTKVSEARCISCHTINGKGGYVANDLGKSASKINETWLYDFIKNPKHLLPGVVMPRYRFSEEDLTGIVSYIESEFVDYDAPPADSTAHVPDPAFYQKGLELFKKYNCAGCHELGDIHASEGMAPDLNFIGSKKLYEIEFGKSNIEQSLPSYLHEKLEHPRVFGPTMKMPNYQFTDDEAKAIVVALLGNTDEKIPDESIVHAKHPAAYVPQGEFGALVNDLACFGCHVMNDNGRLVATDLSMEASQAKPEWIAKYFKVPYSIRPILTERMPNLFLSEAEIRTIVDHMQEVFIADSLNHEVVVNTSTIEKGKALYYDRYGCQSCHQIATKGGYVGPALDNIGGRLTSGWIYHWLKNPQAYKPATIEPNNKLSDEEAEALTAYLLSLK